MEFLQITLTGWVSLSIAISMAFLSGLMFILGKKRFHYVWAIFCAAVAVWSYGFYMVTLAQDPAMALFWWKISYIGTILNPFLYLHFTLEFTQYPFFSKFKKVFLVTLYSIAGIFLYLDLATNLIVNHVAFLFGEIYYDTPPGSLYIYFMGLFLVLIIFSLYIIYREYKKRINDTLFRQRAIYFFVASSIAYIGGGMNFLPVYGIEVSPITNFTVAFGAVFIAYAIIKRGLFDIKVAIAQLLALVLSVYALVRVFSATTFDDVVLSLFMFIVTVGISIYLILSVRNEVIQREKAQKLAKELQETNTRQEGLIHFIGHEVKGFLTKAQGVFSLLVEGDLGQLSNTMKPFVERALQDTRDGVASVSDILKASNIKKGTMVFKKEPFDFRVLVEEIVENTRSIAEGKGLIISLKIDDADYHMIGDKGEIKDHVLRNLIDNAVNYTPEGSINASLKKENGKIIFAVQDTGIGITDEDKKHLFTEGGHGKDSIKTNVHSTGYGLFIAKQITEAHGGTIYAESAGKDKGSLFIIELPI